MKMASFNEKIYSWFSKNELEKNSKFLDSINCYSLENFKQRLILERRRAERFNIRSAIIIFTLKPNERTNNYKIKSRAKTLLQILCSNLRETDAVTFYNFEKILILLPDTDLHGARYVCNILYKQINTSLLSQNEEMRFLVKNMEIEILSFPEKVTDEKLEQYVPLGQNKSSYNTSSKPLSNINMSNLTDLEDQNSPVIFNNCSDGASIVLNIVNTPFIDKQVMTHYFLIAQKGIKQIFDFVAAWLLLIGLMPLLLIISLLIKLTSSGPVLYKQRRIGYNGKEFLFYKFRSMYNNNDDRIHKEYIKKLIAGKIDEINNGSEDNPEFKLKNDSRITSIGKFIRKTSIDELPQLWNVIKGDMSMIGPRPPIPYEVEAYKTWHYRRIIEVKPGITGLWQVKGRNQTTFDDMVRFDIQYVKNWTLWLDFKILLGTFTVFFNTTGS